MNATDDGLTAPATYTVQARLVRVARDNGWVVEDIPARGEGRDSRVRFLAPDAEVKAGEGQDIILLSTRWTPDGWWGGCTWRRRNTSTKSTMSLAEAEAILYAASPTERGVR